jgi:hypothetical protein
MSHEDDLYERLPDLVGMHPAREDEAELRETIERSPRLRARLESLRRMHTLLRSADRAERPSPALAARVLAIPGLAPRSATLSPSRRGWAAIGAVAAAACVAALLVVASVSDADTRFEPIGEPTALQSAGGEPTAITVQLGAAGDGEQPVRLVASGLSSDGPAYELWLKGPSGTRKIGEFAPDKYGDCSLLFVAPSDEWAAAMITHADESPGKGTIASAAI